MSIQNYDFHPLKHYSFSLNKTNYFFSLPTLLLSLSIFCISVLINLQTVSHLWRQRKDLPMKYTKTLSMPNQLSDTLLCISSDDPSLDGTTPKIVFTDSLLKQLNFPFVNKDWILKNKPFLANQVDSHMSCVNIAGYKFTEINSLFSIYVYASTASIYIEFINQNSILQHQGSILKKIGFQNTGFGLILKTISAEIKDSYRMNSQPQKLTMFYNEQIIIFGLITQNDSVVKYTIEHFTLIQKVDFSQSWNRVTLSITRLDFGFIIGVVLTWISILTFAFGTVFSYYLDKLTILQQISCIFYLKPSMREPSLIKFIIASFKKGIFVKQDNYVKLSQKLQKLKDISYVLKIKNTLRRLSPFLNKSLKQKQVNICDYNFLIESKAKQQVVFNDQSTQNSHNSFDFGESQERKVNILNSVKKSILNYLDYGSDFISIKYKNPHKSKCSFLLSIFFFVGFLLLLSMLGAFEQNKSVSLSNSKEYNFQFQLKQHQIILVTYSPQQILVNLLDGYYNKITDVKLINSSDCLNGLTQDQKANIMLYGNYIYCFPQTIQLVQSLDKRQVVSLFINNTNFQNYQAIYLFHYQTNTTNFYYNPLTQMILFFPPSLTDNFFYQSSIKLINFVDQNKQKSVSFQTTVVQTIKGRHLPGINILLDKVQINIDENINSFFDLIQNIWGFATLFFGILLNKLTRYINIHQRDKNVTKQRAEYNEDICILLSKINTLQTGRHRPQLQKGKYYFKTQMIRK